MKKRTALLVLVLCAGSAALFGIYLATQSLQEFGTDLESFVVEQVIRTQQEWFAHPDKDLPDTYLVAHRQTNHVNLGIFTLWGTNYFAGWQLKDGQLRQLTASEWWHEANKDLTAFWIFSFRPPDGNQMYVDLDGIEPKRFSLDGATNRVGGSFWVLDYSEPTWEFKRRFPGNE